jgi:hypothetical protein
VSVDRDHPADTLRQLIDERGEPIANDRQLARELIDTIRPVLAVRELNSVGPNRTVEDHLWPSRLARH